MRFETVSLFLAVFSLTACTQSDGPTSTGGSAAPPVPASARAAPPRKELTPPPTERLGVLAPGTGVAVGSKVPDVHARDLDGHDVSLSSLYAESPVLLVFYRGGWCPYCNTEIHALTTAYPEFRKRGVRPVAISVDRPDEAAATKATYTIPFPVLSDTHAAVVEAFHVAKKLDAGEVLAMKQKNVDLEAHAGDAHHVISIPSLFLIDKSGTVRWAHSDPDFKVRPTTRQMLDAIDGAL